ncbi:FixH family protein, partial [Candidatus Micrarchaeota archaeon]|nr:FixH family protein [Candidatus Micrarchaeota archaeon]
RHETQIKVQPTRESSYLVLTLLRPSEKKQNRASEMPITIKVTDGGNPLTDANVMMWGPDGSRHELKVQQDGLYSLQYFIPIDASLGLWAVTVTAERNSGGTTIGGERVFNMSVGYAPVEIIFESPEASNFELGFEIPVTAKIRYPDGRPFTESVVLNVRGAEFPMERGANNTYNYRYMPLENSIGAVELIVEAKDKYGNSGSASKTVTINEGMFSIENIMLAGAGTALAAVILVYLFLRSRFGVLKRKKHAKGVKENVEAQILSLKKDYYEKASISKGTFRKRMSELEAELEVAGNGGKK